MTVQVAVEIVDYLQLLGFVLIDHIQRMEEKQNRFLKNLRKEEELMNDLGSSS